MCDGQIVISVIFGDLFSCLLRPLLHSPPLLTELVSCQWHVSIWRERLKGCRSQRVARQARRFPVPVLSECLVVLPTCTFIMPLIYRSAVEIICKRSCRAKNRSEEEDAQHRRNRGPKEQNTLELTVQRKLNSHKRRSAGSSLNAACSNHLWYMLYPI